MTLTAEGLCNMALDRIGATPMATGDLAAKVTDEAKQCDRHYEQTRDALLRSHTWRFASLWVELVIDEEADSGTSTDDTNTTLKFYDTGQAWTINEHASSYLWITGGTGSDQIRTIASNTATYLVPSVAFTTVPDDTSTYEIWANYPPYPWDYQYDLPSDFLRFAKTDPLHEPFEIVGTLLKSDEDAVTIEYVRQETDPDLFDPLFVDALVAALATRLVMPLLHDKNLHKELQVEAEVALSKARLANQQESKMAKQQTWNEARV